MDFDSEPAVTHGAEQTDVGTAGRGYRMPVVAVMAPLQCECYATVGICHRPWEYASQRNTEHPFVFFGKAEIERFGDNMLMSRYGFGVRV